MLNNGDGTFQAPQMIDSEPYMSWLAVQDLTGSGKLDLVVCSQGLNSSPGAAYLYLGNGKGTFQAAVPLNIGSVALAFVKVAIADVNGDGKLDLVFALTS